MEKIGCCKRLGRIPSGQPGSHQGAGSGPGEDPNPWGTWKWLWDRWGETPLLASVLLNGAGSPFLGCFTPIPVPASPPPISVATPALAPGRRTQHPAPRGGRLPAAPLGKGCGCMNLISPTPGLGLTVAKPFSGFSSFPSCYSTRGRAAGLVLGAWCGAISAVGVASVRGVPLSWGLAGGSVPPGTKAGNCLRYNWD